MHIQSTQTYYSTTVQQTTRARKQRLETPTNHRVRWLTLQKPGTREQDALRRGCSCGGFGKLRSGGGVGSCLRGVLAGIYGLRLGRGRTLSCRSRSGVSGLSWSRSGSRVDRLGGSAVGRRLTVSHTAGRAVGLREAAVRHRRGVDLVAVLVDRVLATDLTVPLRLQLAVLDCRRVAST